MSERCDIPGSTLTSLSGGAVGICVKTRISCNALFVDRNLWHLRKGAEKQSKFKLEIIIWQLKHTIYVAPFQGKLNRSVTATVCIML